MTSPIIEQALQRLVPYFSTEVFSVPCTGVASTSIPFDACVTSQGVLLSDALIAREPENLHKYIAHEIFHHVIHDASATHKYSQQLVNIAEDYKINALLKQLFGWDMAALGGLYDPRFDSKTVGDIAEELKPKQANTARHQLWGAIHPALLRVAQIIQKRYHIGGKAHAFYMDAIDLGVFTKSYPLAHAQLQSFAELRGIDTPRLLTGLWGHCYLSTAVAATPHNTPLTHSDALSYAFPAPRERTKGCGEESMLASIIFAQKADQDEQYIQNKCKALRTRLEGLRAELVAKHARKHQRTPKRTPKRKAKAKARKSLSRAQLTTAIIATERALRMWGAKVPLHILLDTHPLATCARTPHPQRVTPTQMRAHTPRVAYSDPSVAIPPLTRNETWVRIQQIGKRSLAVFESTADAYTQLVDAFGEQSPAEDPGEEDERIPGESPATSGDAEGDANGEGSPGVGEEAGDVNPTGQGKDSPGKSQQAQAGKGRGGKSKLGTLLDIAADIESITRILKSMQEVETLLSKMSRKRVQSKGADTRYDYGNDLERVDSSELALLANENTALEFFARLASHSLLLRVPPQEQRLPVVLCVDCSGSMHGAFYATACGFALAMMRHLQRDKRGVALLTFSDEVTGEVVVDANTQVPISRTVTTLASPSFGGTNFDSVLRRAFAIKHEHNWKNAMVVLISDGYDSVHADTAALKAPGDRVLAALTTKSTAGVACVCDEIFQIGNRGNVIQLIPLAHTIL